MISRTNYILPWLQVERVIHPAGVGTFCTERIYVREQDRTYTMVYDCGSKKHQTVVEKEAIGYLGNSKIDLLCISHFDEDHVNVIGKLLANKNITSNTKVLVPFFDQITTDLLKQFSPTCIAYFSVLAQLDEAAMVIRVPLWTETDAAQNTTIDINQQQVPYFVSGRIKIVINSPSKGEPVWEFVPFHLRNQRIVDNFFKKVWADTAIPSNDMQELKQKKLPTGWGPAEIEKYLKKHYQATGSSGSTSGINASSMLLYSSATNIHFSVCHILKATNQNELLSALSESKHSSSYYENPIATACLYTGDITFNSKECRANFNQIKNIHFPNGVGLLQVPHHGSHNNYNLKKMLSLNAQTWFVCTDPASVNPQLYFKIALDTMENHIPLRIVTADVKSRYEEMYMVML